jgi:hypothetical protein
LSMLDHPNIVACYESFLDEDGVLHIVMEYADGGDLFQRIQSQEQMKTFFPETVCLSLSLSFPPIHRTPSSSCALTLFLNGGRLPLWNDGDNTVDHGVVLSDCEGFRPHPSQEHLT